MPDSASGLAHRGVHLDRPDGGLRLDFGDDFVDGWDDELKPPDEIVDEALYEGLVHWLAGHFGSGKSTLAAHWSYLAMTDQRHVFWLDWETSAEQARARLRGTGIPKKLAREYLHYAERPTVPPERRAVEALLNRMSDAAGGDDELRRAVVVIDSFTKAQTLAMPGSDESGNTDVSRWTEAVLIGLKRRGVTVVVIDHPTKDQKASNPYVGRGAGAKADDADIAYFTVAERPFKRDRIGTVRLVCHKDRESVIMTGGAWLPSKDSGYGEQWFQVGDAKGGLPVSSTPPLDPVAPGEDFPKVERYVAAVAGAMRLADSLTTKRLATACGSHAQDSTFKRATHLAQDRQLIAKSGRGVYAPGEALGLEEVSLS